MSTISKVGDGVSGVVIGVYFGAVLWQSLGTKANQTLPGMTGTNLNQLLVDLEQDYGYLEFLVAAGIIKVLYDIPAFHDIVIAFVIITIVGVLLTRSSGPGNSILTYLKSFGAGNIGLFGESVTPSAGQTVLSGGSANAGKSVQPAPIRSAAGATIGV